jgi:uncharacterized protein
LSIYADTSVLVAALSSEARTGDAQNWLRGQPPGDLLTSDWTIAEFSSALSLKLRTGVISVVTRATTLGAFKRLIDESFELVPITPGAFRTAAAFCDHHLLNLRSGDALHLAAAFDRGVMLCTLDKRMAAAGSALGLSTHLL